MDEITIRPYENGDEFSINKAYNEIFGLRRSIEEWYWKFGPKGENSRIMLAVDYNGQVLSNYSAITVPMQIDGIQLLCAQSVDSYSVKNPGILKNKIFIKTYDKYCTQYGGPDKIPYFYGCIGMRPVKLGNRVMNYTDPVPITYLCSSETSILLRPYGMLFGNIVWNLRCSRHKNPDWGSVDALWIRSSHRYPVSTVKDGGYITRRYLKNPAKKYICVAAHRDGIMSGLAVFSYVNRMIQWVELLWDGRSPETLTVLKEHGWNLTLATGSVKMEMWLCNDEEALKILVKLGMKTTRNPYELYLSSRSFDKNLDAKDITSRLYFTMGDTDMF